jgi:hypothetical protein
MTDEPRRKATWFWAGAAAVAGLALFFTRGDGPPPAAAPPPPAPPADVAAKAVAPAPTLTARPSAAAADAGPADEGAVARSMPPPNVIDAEAQNPEIEPELPKTPEWHLGKTATILRAVERRAARVQGEIATLDAEGKRAEAEEKRVLLGRLHKQVAKMKSDIAGYAEQIAGAGADGQKAPEGASP